ncbi:hypothetical protein H311_04748, partial [Anncaliia algerae PRA109]
HGFCKHSTNECFIIKKLESKGWTKNELSIASNEKDIKYPKDNGKHGDGFENRNKKSFIYSIFKKSKNIPFFIKIKIFEKETVALIDTGADVSLINQNSCKISKLVKTNKQILSANGSEIQIIGKLDNIKIQIGKESFKIHPYVSTMGPDYIILGIDFIQKYPEFVKKIVIAKLNPTHNDSKIELRINNITNNNISMQNIISKYKSIFKENVDESILCSINTHSITTNSDK